MADSDKFQVVAKSYSEKFGFDPYYSVLIELLEKYVDNAKLALEIGSANGIVPEKWSTVRKKDLEYYSVEPVKEMVDIAQKKAPKLAIHYHPFLGNLGNALAACNLSNTKIDLLVTSRSLHEIYLNYDRNLEKVFSDLSKIMMSSIPDIVIYGDTEKNTNLTPNQTSLFIKLQTAIIGHGHDPATDYLDPNAVINLMANEGYKLIDRKNINQPVEGFNPSPWNFALMVFKKI